MTDSNKKTYSHFEHITLAQNIWAKELLEVQAQLLKILYTQGLLEFNTNESPVNFGAIDPSQFSTEEWNKYKKNYKIPLQYLKTLVSQIHQQSVLQQTAQEFINKILLLRLQIIQSFIPLIQFLAKRYSPQNYSLYSDLKSEGYIGLIKSLENFYYIDDTKPLKSYSNFYIKQEMRRFLLENKQGYKIPYIASIKQQEKKNNHTLDTLEISQVHYFSDLSTNDGGVFENQIASSLSDPMFLSWEKDLAETLKNTLDTLPIKEKQVLELRYGIQQDYEKLSLEKIGNIMGLSKERVRQIEKQALEHLYKKTKDIFRLEDLEDFY